MELFTVSLKTWFVTANNTQVWLCSRSGVYIIKIHRVEVIVTYECGVAANGQLLLRSACVLSGSESDMVISFVIFCIIRRLYSL